MILPKRKPKTNQETTKEKIIRVLQYTAGIMSGRGEQGNKRRDQFKTYMTMIDKLQNTKIQLRGRISLGNLEAKTGRVPGAATTNMSTIMNKYHDKALRMAQAKYYQKQLG